MSDEIKNIEGLQHESLVKYYGVELHRVSIHIYLKKAISCWIWFSKPYFCILDHILSVDVLSNQIILVINAQQILVHASDW